MHENYILHFSKNYMQHIIWYNYKKKLNNHLTILGKSFFHKIYVQIKEIYMLHIIHTQAE